MLVYDITVQIWLGLKTFTDAISIYYDPYLFHSFEKSISESDSAELKTVKVFMDISFI
jgi:hypothetical protein